MVEAFLGINFLIIPLIMLVFGRIFLNSPPKKINSVYGYRTTMSTINTDTWKFAHYHCGKLWVKIGAISFIISIAVFIVILFISKPVRNVLLILVPILQIFALIIPVFLVEKRLKNTFDKFGRRIVNKEI